ncbi:MAG TPA: hypothetical protein VFV93_10205 [Thermomicrobiales bacterium]|nr:hypothetical protein [Thermomicrobiales bacterium]
MDATDAIVFVIVVLGRFAIPLGIPRYPLPSIIAAMILDAADQTIFQQFTSLNLDGYQSYDKALDIYYLAIAYISTLRNWTSVSGYSAARFLWYYRLVGVTAFELTQWRPLLLIFPNTFEYFFDWFEGVRTRWNPVRLTQRHVISAAAFIWIFIKLPQEYWIHIAKLDTTDLIKENILGVSTDTPWGEALSQNLWVFPVLLAVAVGLVLFFRWLRKRLPEPDWKTTFDVDTHLEPIPPELMQTRRVRSIRYGLLEKIVLVGLMIVVFAQMLPNIDVNNVAVVAGVAFVIAINAFVSHWFALRGTEWRSLGTELAAMAAINLAAGMLYLYLLPGSADDLDIGAPIFFALLLTLIVVLYDRYRPIHDARMQMAAATVIPPPTIAGANEPEQSVAP